MPYYTVSIRTTLKASSPEEAQAVAQDRLSIGKDDPHELWSSSGEVEELSEDEVTALLRFRAMLNQAMRDSAAGVYVEDPKHPGVRFSPGAAASLAALEFEAGIPPEG